MARARRVCARRVCARLSGERDDASHCSGSRLVRMPCGSEAPRPAGVSTSSARLTEARPAPVHLPPPAVATADPAAVLAARGETAPRRA
jgi:hypothetical protein